MSTLVLRRVAIASIRPDPQNARTHDETNVAAIRASLERFGQVEPLVVRPSDGRLIAGHGRLEAMRALGWTEADVVDVEVSDAQAAALGVALNRTAELAGWDSEALAKIIDSLEDDADLAALGFSDGEVDRLLREAGLRDPLIDDDAAIERPAHPTSRLGDLWLLGKHRVLCGDSTRAEDVGRLLAGAKPFLMVTDPPYGVEYDPTWRARAGLTETLRGAVRNDDCADWRAAWKNFSGDVAYVWHGGLHAATVAQSLEACGFRVRAQIVWVKPRLVISRGHYHWAHEPCFVADHGGDDRWRFDPEHELVDYAARDGCPAAWDGGRRQSTVWSIQNPACDTGHGTQKPIECMARPMRNHDADEVYDPFLGSGSTVIAAERCGRACFGLELDPAYVDVIVSRWEKATGQKAVLDGTTATFAEVAEQRGIE